MPAAAPWPHSPSWSSDGTINMGNQMTARISRACRTRRDRRTGPESPLSGRDPRVPEMGPSTLSFVAWAVQGKTMTANTQSNTEELPAHTCWELLRQTPVGRLAIVADGHPDIFPVNYVVDHGTVVFRTAAGTKLAGTLRHDVAFEADGYDSEDGTAWSVVLKGRAERIVEPTDSISAMSLGLTPWQDGNKPWFLRIVASSLTGRRVHVAQH